MLRAWLFRVYELCMGFRVYRLTGLVCRIA